MCEQIDHFRAAAKEQGGRELGQLPSDSRLWTEVALEMAGEAGIPSPEKGVFAKVLVGWSPHPATIDAGVWWFPDRSALADTEDGAIMGKGISTDCISKGPRSIPC